MDNAPAFLHYVGYGDDATTSLRLLAVPLLLNMDRVLCRAPLVKAQAGTNNRKRATLISDVVWWSINILGGFCSRRWVVPSVVLVRVEIAAPATRASLFQMPSQPDHNDEVTNGFLRLQARGVLYWRKHLRIAVRYVPAHLRV